MTESEDVQGHKHINNRMLKAGEVLFAEGDPSNSIFIVQMGSIKVSRIHHNKRLN